jgi:TfoX/Sxy family transcriptional regulator of competence genes
MAWVKIPKQNHPVLLAALPKDKRVVTIQMFGGVAGLVNGNMFGGLFGRSAIVKLSDADLAEAMTLDGTEPFDPMGNGRVMANTVLLPEAIMDEPAELAVWLRKAFDYTATLPAKKKSKSPATKQSKKPRKR